MSKVITFSREFPAYHPKVGQPTFFVEKFLNNKNVHYKLEKYLQDLTELNKTNLTNGKLSFDDLIDFQNSLIETKEDKSHTIRNGNRFEFMEFFSPRVWSKKPYNSPQILFYKDTAINNTFNFEIKKAYQMLPLDYEHEITIGYRIAHSDDEIMKTISKNDGLTLAELLQWFKYPASFKGQIICWNDKIKY